MEPTPLSLTALLAEFPLFVLRLFSNPRSLVRGIDFSHNSSLEKLAFFALLFFAILTFAFSDRRPLAGEERPLLSTFKGVIMRAHERSWQYEGQGWPWLELKRVYAPFNIEKDEAKRLWDTLLTPGFLAYTFFAGLLATALVARLRQWRFSLGWEHAIGTGLLGYMASAACAGAALVPLGLLLLCRHCGVRLALFILLSLAAWAYTGYYCLGDLGERPRGIALLGKSLGYGLLLYLLAYIIFFALICIVIPI